MIYLPRCVGALTGLVASESACFAMTAVRVRELADGFWRLEATDGRRLGIVRGSSRPSAPDEFAARKLPPPEAFLTEALVPAAALATVIKHLPKDRHAPERQLGLLLASPEPVLLAGDSNTRVQQVEGRYPDVDAVIPKEGARFAFRVSADLLIGILRAAREIAATADESGVEILYWGHGRPIGITSKGACGLTFDGILMPMV